MAAGELFSSFDDESGEFDMTEGAEESPQPQQVRHARHVQQEEDEELVQVGEYEEELDEHMSEAERRISLAGYYKQIAKGGVFKDGSEEAKIVDDELREFARERMDALLNLGNYKPKVELPFTEDQVQVLKHLADRYVQKQQAPAQPVVRPLAPPAPPAAPVQAKPVGPQVQTLAPPASARKPAQPAQAAPKPRAKKPAPQPVQAAPQPQSPKQKRRRVNVEEMEPGTIFEEGGKQYKVVLNPDTGEKLKVRQTAGQVVPPNYRPMSDQELMHASAMHAERTVNNNPALRNQTVALATAMAATGVNQIGGE